MPSHSFDFLSLQELQVGCSASVLGSSFLAMIWELGGGQVISDEIRSLTSQHHAACLI